MSTRKRKEVDPEGRAAKHRAQQELGIKIERVRPVTKFLLRSRHMGVIAVEGPVTDDFMIGLEVPLGRERILRLPAEGNIQGKELGLEHTQKTTDTLSQHRREHKGRGLVILEGTKFSGDVGTGSPRVYRWISEAMERQAKDKASHLREPMILAVGEGEARELPSNSRHNDEDFNASLFASSLVTCYALLGNGELSSMYEPNPRQYQYEEIAPSHSQLKLDIE